MPLFRRRAPATSPVDAGASPQASALAVMQPGLDRQGMGVQRPFSPGAPIAPYEPLGEPPRRWDFRTGRNIAARPRSDEEVAFDTLRNIIRCYDFAQICIRHRVDDVASLKYTIGPIDNTEINVDKAIAEAQRRLAKPDGVTRFKPWLKKYLRDVLRFDAGCLYRIRDHADRVCGLKVIDGTTITPLVDYYGDVPDPDAPAFVQFVNGVPWDWMTAQDLIYEPMWPKSESPYGEPPVEAILLRANTDVRFQLHFLNYFCYDDQTEVLTRGGWRRFAELDGSEEFATRSAGGRFEWQHTVDGTVHRFDYDGELVSFHNTAVDMMVTPNHRMLVRRVPNAQDGHRARSEYGWHIRRADWFVDHPTATFKMPVVSQWDAPEVPRRFELPGYDADRKHPAHDAAVILVRKLLADGPIPAGVGIRAAREHGISDAALRAARRRLGVVTECRGVPGVKAGHEWWWLPPTSDGDQECGRYQPARGLSMPAEAWMRFLGLYLAEGSCDPKRGRIHIPQSAANVKLPEVRRILAETGITWGAFGPYKDGVIRFEASHQVLCDFLAHCGLSASTKRVPAEFMDWPAPLLAALIEGLLLGDGHVTVSGQRVLSTTSLVLAGQMQELWQKTGVYASVKQCVQHPTAKGRLPIYTVRERPGQDFRVPRPLLVPYKGVVSCVSVPNGIIFVRRNGKAVWSGNTEGSLPQGFMEAPADVNDPDKVSELQARWDAVMRGDQARKWDVRWVPFGSKFTPIHDAAFDDAFPLFLMHVCAAAFHVTPNDLGFTEDVNRASSDTQIDVQFRIGTMPLVEHVQEILDSFLQDDLQLPVVGRFDTGQEKEDRLVTAQVWQIGINTGAASSDEFREKVLSLPVDPAQPTPRYILTPRQGPVPLAALYAASGEIDRSTFAPAQGAELPTYPFGGVEGVMPTTTPKLPGLTPDQYGSEGEPLADDDGEDIGPADVEDDPIAAGRPDLAKTVSPDAELAKELYRWRSNARSRVRKGHAPRRFVSTIIPSDVADRVWSQLAKASTVEAVDAAFGRHQSV